MNRYMTATGILVLCIAGAPIASNGSAGETTGATPVAAYVTATDITAAVNQLSPQFTDDEAIRVIDAGPYRLGLFVVGRPKVTGPAQSNPGGVVRVTEGLALDRVAAVIRILRGAGTLVTGGSLVAPERMPPNDPDADVIGPGSRGKAIVGGIGRRVAAGDMVIIPATVPHGFSEIQQPLTYLVTRIDTGKSLSVK